MFRRDISLRVEQIYNDYGKLIFGIAYNLVKNEQSAEDITQETIEKIIKYPEKANELTGNELRNYIARIALNTSYDFLRSTDKKKLKLVELDNLPQQDVKDDLDLEEFVITKETKERLKEEIRNLDTRYRDPLTLHTLYGHTISEVSELLSIPERTVKYRINKAIKILKKVLLKGDGYDER